MAPSAENDNSALCDSCSHCNHQQHATDPRSKCGAETCWMDWFENCGVVGMDFFGCDENCAHSSRRAFHAVVSPDITEAHAQNRAGVDLATLHDNFLESLLHEQKVLQEQAAADTEDTPSLASASWSQASVTTNGSEPSDAVDESHRKRRRPLNKKIPSKDAEGTPYRTGSNASVSVNFSEFSKTDYPDPETYLHPNCAMQKDKGKGEAVGSNLCAKGRQRCLDKFRTKMRLLTEVAFSGSGKGPGTATMKRRKAKVAHTTNTFVETRSVIELRMGFFSMTYGVLLRWERSSEQVTLVVLRKMCHDSFYPSKNHKIDNMSQKSTVHNSAGSVPDVMDNHAILQRPEGTEVSLLGPPYRVPRPDSFDPSVLTISARFATGLSKRSNWTVQLTYDGHTENILMTWDSKHGCLSPKLGKPLDHTIHSHDFELENLEIKLYEHGLRRKNQRRLICSMKVPLFSLDPRPAKDCQPTRMNIPCRHDSDASIALDLYLKSDYACWMSKELEVRRHEEKPGFSARLSSSAAAPTTSDEEPDDTWDWICSVCYY